MTFGFGPSPRPRHPRMEPPHRPSDGIFSWPTRRRHRVRRVPVRWTLAVTRPRHSIQCSASLGPTGRHLVALQTTHSAPLHLVPRTSAGHCSSPVGSPGLDAVNQQPDSDDQPQLGSDCAAVDSADPPPAHCRAAAGSRSKCVAASHPGR